MKNYILFFIFYYSLALIYEGFSIYFGYIKLHKKIKTDPQLQMLKAVVLSTAGGKWLYELSTRWYFLAFIIAPLFIVLAPFLFAYTILSEVYTLLFGKSKAQKKAETEAKKIEQAQKHAAEFMKTEGERMPPPDIDLEMEPPIIAPEPKPSKEQQIVNLVVAIPDEYWKKHTYGFMAQVDDIQIELHTSGRHIEINNFKFKDHFLINEKIESITDYYQGEILSSLKEKTSEI